MPINDQTIISTLALQHPLKSLFVALSGFVPLELAQFFYGDVGFVGTWVVYSTSAIALFTMLFAILTAVLSIYNDSLYTNTRQDILNAIYEVQYMGMLCIMSITAIAIADHFLVRIQGINMFGAFNPTQKYAYIAATMAYVLMTNITSLSVWSSMWQERPVYAEIQPPTQGIWSGVHDLALSTWFHSAGLVFYVTQFPDTCMTRMYYTAALLFAALNAITIIRENKIPPMAPTWNYILYIVITGLHCIRILGILSLILLHYSITGGSLPTFITGIVMIVTSGQPLFEDIWVRATNTASKKNSITDIPDKIM
jgi:hypothetical protein